MTKLRSNEGRRERKNVLREGVCKGLEWEETVSAQRTERCLEWLEQRVCVWGVCGGVILRGQQRHMHAGPRILFILGAMRSHWRVRRMSSFSSVVPWYQIATCL